jgi:hypothetical protein
MRSIPLLTRRVLANLGDGAMQTNVVAATGGPVVDSGQVWGPYSSGAQAAAQAASTAAWNAARATTIPTCKTALATAQDCAGQAADAVTAAQAVVNTDNSGQDRGA